MKTELRNGELFVDGKKSNAQITTTIDVSNDLKVVLLDFRTTNDVRTVFAFDQRGQLVWQIPEEKNKINGQAWPYTALHYTDGKILAFAAGGFEYEIDPADGKIIGEDFLK